MFKANSLSTRLVGASHARYESLTLAAFAPLKALSALPRLIFCLLAQVSDGLALLLRTVERLEDRRHFQGVVALILVLHEIRVLLFILIGRAVSKLPFFFLLLDELLGHDPCNLLVVV